MVLELSGNSIVLSSQSVFYYRQSQNIPKISHVCVPFNDSNGSSIIIDLLPGNPKETTNDSIVPLSDTDGSSQIFRYAFDTTNRKCFSSRCNRKIGTIGAFNYLGTTQNIWLSNGKIPYHPGSSPSVEPICVYEGNGWNWSLKNENSAFVHGAIHMFGQNKVIKIGFYFNLYLVLFFRNLLLWEFLKFKIMIKLLKN